MKKYSYHRSKTNAEIDRAVKQVRKFEWKHRNLIFLLVSLVIAYLILKSGYVHTFISKLNTLGYVGSFVAGIFFTYGLTSVPATATLYIFGQTLNPFLIALIAAFGAVISDYIIFRFVRDKLMDEIKLLSGEINHLTKPVSSLVFTEEIKILTWKRISRSKFWKTLIPVIAGLIIASPLPDELGIAIFGAAKYEPKKFLLLSYCFNFIGVLTIASLAQVLR